MVMLKICFIKMVKLMCSHGFNPVKFSFIGIDGQVKDGGLKDVAPTILELMGIEKPVGMTGESLLVKSP